uniref:RNA-directed DNA polymerase, eukaryota, reverse transcriptase zinc-binding domain protein n=1 Tax=Tanacetum cinerariifolium TaxID=118510 RepID=A0A6L2LVD6_TANCI|nr:hypothetical protein [Tanacetum cinerariifolium]
MDIVEDLKILEEKIEAGSAWCVDRETRIKLLQEIDRPHQIKEAFLNFFKEKFQANDPPVVFPPITTLSKLQPCDRNFIKAHVSIDEVKIAVWDYGSDKAYRPDGFTFDFVKRSRLLIGKRTEQKDVDFEKAFDPIGWKYLDFILHSINLGTTWRSWIKACLESSRTLVLVDGDPSSKFSVKHRLRLRFSFCFWKDTWLVNSSLYVHFNGLFPLEQDKDCLICDRIANGDWSWNWSRREPGVRNSTYLRDMLLEISHVNVSDIDTCVGLLPIMVFSLLELLLECVWHGAVVELFGAVSKSILIFSACLAKGAVSVLIFISHLAKERSCSNEAKARKIELKLGISSEEEKGKDL